MTGSSAFCVNLQTLQLLLSFVCTCRCTLMYIIHTAWIEQHPTHHDVDFQNIMICPWIAFTAIMMRNVRSVRGIFSAGLIKSDPQHRNTIQYIALLCSGLFSVIFTGTFDNKSMKHTQESVPAFYVRFPMRILIHFFFSQKQLKCISLYDKQVHLVST